MSESQRPACLPHYLDLYSRVGELSALVRAMRLRGGRSPGPEQAGARGPPPRMLILRT